MSAAFQRQPWERSPDPWEAGAASDSESDSEHAEGEEAGEALAQMLLHMVFAGKMSAKTACVIAWWASRAGAVGIKDLAFRPSDPATGHYQRKIDSISGIDLRNHNRYLMTVPGTLRYDCSRSTFELPIVLPHETVEIELANNPDLPRQLAEKIANADMPASYAQHIVRQAHAGPVLPIAIFIDGVQFNKRTGMLAFYCYNLVSDVRHMLCVVRRNELCHCGCKGWCSVYAILNTIRWSLRQLALKRHPAVRHDNTPWKARFDDYRSEVAGQDLAMRACLLFYKGDWAEYCHTFGLAGWSTRTSPCPFCKTTADAMKNVQGHSLLGSPAGDTSHDDYIQACRQCEVVVVLTQVHHAAIIKILMYDRRPHGNKGRCLTRDYPPLGLRSGDRLEPCSALLDVGRFEDLADFPVHDIVFWRKTNETRVRHRCPLLDDAEIGLTLDRCMIDLMHTVWLGVGQDWVACVFWSLLDADCFGLNAHRSLTADELLQMGVVRLRAEIFLCYKEQQRLGKPSDFTALEDLTLAMLGDRDHPKFKTKAAECKTLIPFVIGFLTQMRSVLEPQKASTLLAAGNALVELSQIIRASPTQPSVRDCQAMLDLAKRFMLMSLKAGVRQKPKCHLMLHVPKKALFHGHPSLHATWIDETINRHAASIAAVAHRMVWSLRVLTFFEKLFSPNNPKRFRSE